MKIRDVMTPAVRTAAPDATLGSVADLMRRLDSGVVPISENDRLVGMITDRDITIRGVAEGKGPETLVRDVMTAEVRYCFEDEDLDCVAEKMAQLKVRRLPVVDRNKRLVGMVSLADFAGEREARHTLEGVSERGRPYTT